MNSGERFINIQSLLENPCEDDLVREKLYWQAQREFHEKMELHDKLDAMARLEKWKIDNDANISDAIRFEKLQTEAEMRALHQKTLRRYAENARACGISPEIIERIFEAGEN